MQLKCLNVWHSRFEIRQGPFDRAKLIAPKQNPGYAPGNPSPFPLDAFGVSILSLDLQDKSMPLIVETHPFLVVVLITSQIYLQNSGRISSTAVRITQHHG